MSSQNKAIQATIAEIKDKFFEIPAYQRLYEWESTQIEELLNDIKKAYNEGKGQYFIGNITTSKKSENEQEKFVLIDGQQRLTTLWFIGFYLASLEYEWETKDKKVWQDFILQNDNLRIAMPIRDKEREALENLAKKIQKSEIKPNKEKKLELSKDLQGIHQKIIDAFYCIESWFNENFSKDDNEKEIDFERLNCFANFIYTKVRFVFVELAQTDLNRFFVRMNNRGKQLEKHEILKARILDKIKDDKDWQKYAKIWDLCSDMNKYIFQSANDRKILNPKAKNDKKVNNKDETENDRTKNDKLVHLAEIAEKYTIIKDNKKVKDNGAHSGAESIIDFPTFLLHCYKLWVVKKCNENEIPKEITIAKDRLLEIMWDAKEDKNKHNYLFVKRDKQDCKDFIVDMLYYRVLFDYFVIKNTLSDDGFAIMRLYENKGTYQAKLKVFTQLTMIQNYLRVARQGDRQNYYHWLTPFLAYLDTQKDKILVFEKSVLDLDFAKWKTEKDGNKTAECEDKTTLIAKRFSKSNDENLQNDLIVYLSKLDTALSKEQLGANSENKLLLIANEAIQATFKAKSLNDDINWNFKSITDKWKQYATKDSYEGWDFLNNGTGTPHYWFYRLEYYLWKNGVENEENLKIRGKSFSEIRKNFYFRNLGSIEHFQPQSEPDEKWWLNNKSEMDTFGNLALISRSLNSSLGKQNLDKKEIDIAKEGNSESLKLVLMCCLKNNNNAENGANSKAQAHQNQMIDILIESLKDSQGK